MRVLEVWLHDELIGHVVENRKGGRFAYAPEIAKRFPGIPLLSLCMPAKQRPFGEAKTASWFEGLLPEGERRDAACRRLGLSPYDWIGLLAEIGWECAGAVRVFGEGDARGRSGSYESLSQDGLAARLADLPSRLPMPNGSSYRMSLGGLQDKMCVAMPRFEAGSAYVGAAGVLLPQGDAPSTHILKPEPASYPGAAESEAWAMTVAAQAARCANVALLDLPGAPATLAVERYDRQGSWPQDVARVHQEDACQALGLPPNRKYASPAALGDDPTYGGIARLLMRYASDPEEEMAELLRQVAVSFALGNWDAHAKNISFIFETPAVPAIAPLYDVVPIAEVEPRTTALSLRIGGSLDPNSVSRALVLSETESWGLSRPLAQEVLDKCIEDVARGFDAARGPYPDAAARHENRALRRLEQLR